MTIEKLWCMKINNWGGGQYFLMHVIIRKKRIDFKGTQFGKTWIYEPPNYLAGYATVEKLCWFSLNNIDHQYIWSKVCFPFTGKLAFLEIIKLRVSETRHELFPYVESSQNDVMQLLFFVASAMNVYTSGFHNLNCRFASSYKPYPNNHPCFYLYILKTVLSRFLANRVLQRYFFFPPLNTYHLEKRKLQHYNNQRIIEAIL